jgi:hypothetical protein
VEGRKGRYFDELDEDGPVVDVLVEVEGKGVPEHGLDEDGIGLGGGCHGSWSSAKGNRDLWLCVTFV